MIKVYGYTNYRKFLQDFYEEKKSAARGFSYRQFSKKCGFSSPNFIKLVMDGSRNLSPQSVEKLIEGLGLKDQEAKYFRTLILFNQESKQESKAIYIEELKKLTPYQQRRMLDTESVEYLSHWIYPVLREMAIHGGFKDDAYWISRRLTGRVSVKEIRKALKFLLDHSFIVKEDGRYVCPDRVVLSSDEMKSFAVRQYHKAILVQAQEALEDLEVTEREFGALIFSLPEESIGELKGKLKEIRKDLHEWALKQTEISKDSEEQVVQFNFQMFPQSRKA